jgi:hypothetical protein
MFRRWRRRDHPRTAQNQTEGSLAQENRATILTTDKDFFHTVPFAFPEHCGVVVVTLKKPSSKAILQRLQESWDSLTRTGFKNQAFLLTDSRIYARRK